VRTLYALLLVGAASCVARFAVAAEPALAVPSKDDRPVPASERVLAEAVTVVDVIPRAAWGAKPVKGAFKLHTVRILTVHHSAQFAPDVAGAPARIRGYQAYHQSRGFPDLAYHFVVDRAGNVYQGRDPGTVGSTFTKYDPTGHFLALLDGNFEAQPPSSEQMTALATLLAWASQAYSVAPETIGAHRDYAATACPGRTVVRLLQDGSLRAQVRSVLAGGPVALRMLDDAQGAERVRAIEASHRIGHP
jgi:hypothetical protein